MSLGDQLQQIAERHKVRLETVVRKTVLEMGASMVRMSPVDTGRFRGAWVYGDGPKPNDQPHTLDKAGALSIGRITAGVASWKPGEPMWVVNNLPYAQRLEVGWSRQAPAGMVRITVENFQAHFARALGGKK